MKKELRKKGLDILKSLVGEERNKISTEIEKSLYQTELWKKSNVIGITISQAHEIDTYPVIKNAWEDGKQVAIPKCYPKQNQLVFYQFTSFDDLETVYYGLKEPIMEKTKELHRDEIDLMIVPGLLFDNRGYRIGYGGGYYDRYLVHFPNHTIALATNRQLVEEVPNDVYDIPVQHLITESGVIY
ncbi:5-formyltetrahydrofolate cyclo-ligase [Pontibacillus yanchengensis]|uniref:5-formyltetrahydrofolate cyclo-ligase n=1 Tax=Pontibacillus yanchengensis TaxID=462910 RepID=UPI001371B5E1